MKRTLDLSSEIGQKLYLNEDDIVILIREVLEGRVKAQRLEKALKKELKITDLKIRFYNKRKKLYIDLNTDSFELDKNRIIDVLKTIISEAIYETLTNRFTNRRIVFITEASGIPLIGSIYFGILDRGTNLLQVRPITGCILNCVFCSVDEGSKSKTRGIDYIIEPEYLIQELKKIIEYKGVDDIEIHLDGQGEPLTYPYMVELIEKISQIKAVKVISMQTNGVLLDEKMVFKLEKAGLNRINLSINSLKPKISKILAGTKDYNINKILRIVDRIKKSKIDLLIAPVVIPGINDDQIEEIIEYFLRKKIKSKWPIFGFQNYIPYQFGRKVKVKPMNFTDYYQKLGDLEKSYNLKLFLTPMDFNIHKTKKIENPIEKRSILDLKIGLPGRIYAADNQEMLGIAKNRLVHVIKCNCKIGDVKKVKIFRNKHNINYAKLV